MTTLDTALARLAARARTDGVLVALDFDGVLAPLVDDPGTSRPVPAAARALDRLARGPAHLALVSGRVLVELADRARPPEGTHLVGGHGAERGVWRDGRLDRDELHLTPAEAALRDDLADRLTGLVAGTTARVEHKPIAVVLHTRTAAPDDAARLVGAAVALGARPGVDVLHGNNVVELSVRQVSKGRALTRLRDELGVGAVLYAGDDTTDERAFAVLGPADVTIKVGPGDTAARWRVADPTDLAAVLTRLADLLG